jgi:hypothetical protein
MVDILNLRLIGLLVSEIGSGEVAGRRRQRRESFSKGGHYPKKMNSEEYHQITIDLTHVH